MASDRHLAKLKEGAESWNGWRRAEPAARPDLQGISLSLGDKQWGETNGGPIDLSRALLREANLRHATLMQASLSEASLVGADLTGARLKRADLRNADLSHARLDDADLEEALLDGANLAGADLRSARNLKPAQLETARGDPKTLLPSRFVTPRAWMNGPRQPAFAAAPAPAAPVTPVAQVAQVAQVAKTKWTGTFSKAPASNGPSPAPAKPSWVSGFGQPAAPVVQPSGAASQKGSWISAFAKPDAALNAAPRASWATTLAKTAAPAIAAASAAAAAKASWTAGFLKSSASSAGSAFVLPKRSEAKSLAATDTKSSVTGSASAASGIGARAETKVVDLQAAPATKPAAAKPAAATSAEPKAADAIAADRNPAAIPADKSNGRPTRFAEALEGKTATPAEQDLDEDNAIDEGPDPRWIADLARSAGATPLEEAAQRVRDWCAARLRGFARLNPVRALRSARRGLGGFRPLRAIAARLNGFSGAASSRARAAGGALGSSLGALFVPLQKTSIRIGIAGLVGLALIAGAARLIHARHVGAETLNENVTLSAEPGAEEQPQRVALLGPARGPEPVKDVKGQSVVPLAEPSTQVASLAKPSAPVAPIKSEVPLGTIQPVGVKEEAESAIKPEAIPVPKRARENGTQVTLAAATDRAPSETAKATEAEDATKVAQGATVRPHGEIATPADISDPATPLVVSPQAAKKPVTVPVQTRTAAPVPVPQPVPKQAAPENEDAANKLSFAGGALSALQTAKKPPATVVEYLKEPTKSTEWIETFIKKFYLSSAALSDGEVRAIYSEPMDFFGEKNVDLDRVAREKSDYYKEWPKRHYKLVPDSIEVEWASENVAQVSFLYDFDVAAPHKQPNRGRGRAVLTIDLTESPGKITREDGEVVSGE